MLAINHVDEHVANVIFDKAAVGLRVLIGELEVFLGEKIAKLFDHPVIRHKIARNRFVNPEVVFPELEEQTALKKIGAHAAREQLGLYRIIGGLIHLDVGGDAPAAEYLAPSIGVVDLRAWGRTARGSIQVVIERGVKVVPLDQASTRRIVMRRRQRQARTLAERVDRLHQTLAETSLAHHQGAVMVLQRSGHDLGGAGCLAIDQHHDGVVLPAFAVPSVVALFAGMAAVMVNNELVLLQEAIRDVHGGLQQPTPIAAQVENQALEVLAAQRLERLRQLVARGLDEVVNVNVGHSRTDQEVVVHAQAGDFFPGNLEIQRLIIALAAHRDANGGAPRPLQHLRHRIAVQAFCRFPIHLENEVAWTQASPKRRRARHGLNDGGHPLTHLARNGQDPHAHAEVLAFLVFAEPRECLRAEKIRVWIERAEHSRNGPLGVAVLGAEDRVIRIDGVRIVLLHQGIDFGEGVEVATQGACINVRRGRDAPSIKTPHQGAGHDCQ